jgi:sugar-specific transcriptional regulator TrmB
LAEAIKEGVSLSIVIFEVKNYDTLQEKLGQDKSASIMHSLGQLVKTGLKRKSDISIKDSRAILVALPETDKKGVWSISERLKSSFDDYLSKEELAEEIEVGLRVASFPEDANTEKELLNKVQL